ncbi:FAD-dependent oxidoreductase [Brevibacterium salitolerans]|uniref:FAD/NAD(P)-binding domain-containing protein n=1 Tax=Brevibacterium salitolerans TaxID=1403566 RepID=A0ABN2WBV4_9MICO
MTEADARRTLVVAGGGAAGRAAAAALVAALGPHDPQEVSSAVPRPEDERPWRVLHLTGPEGEAVDRTMVDKAVMTGRLTPEKAAALRPPLAGAETSAARLVRVDIAGTPADQSGSGPCPAPRERPGSAVRADTAPLLRLTLESGAELEAAALIVATGSAPHQLEVPGAGAWRSAGRLSSLHTVEDAVRIRALVAGAQRRDSSPANRPLRVVVSGTGLVGAEAASLLREAGCAVTLVARSVLPAARSLGEPVARRLASLHSAAVDARWGVRITELGSVPTVAGGPGAVLLSDGTQVAADLVVAAHGSVPAPPAGLRAGDSAEAMGADGPAVPGWGSAGAADSGAESVLTAGLPVDSRLRLRGAAAEAAGLGDAAAGAGAPAASGAGVWASSHDPEPVPVWAAGAVAVHAGETAYRIDHWDDAEAQGAHAARSLLHAFAGGEDPGPYSPVSPWSARIHGHQLAGFGAVVPGVQVHTVSEDPLLVEFAAPVDGRVRAVVGLDAGRSLRDHARGTLLSA